MKYTAGELRKMNGKKCVIKIFGGSFVIGEIYVLDDTVNFVSNHRYYNCVGKLKAGYDYSYLLYDKDRDDFYNPRIEYITFLDEPHQNIYHDDNGEEIREGDWVLVGDKSLNLKRIFLCKIPRCVDGFVCVNENQIELYNEGSKYLGMPFRPTCIKYKEPEKKLRELMLTDEEYEEVKNKYK